MSYIPCTMSATAPNPTWKPTSPGFIFPFRITQWKIKGKKFSNSFHVEEGPNKAFEIQFEKRYTLLSLLLLLSEMPSKESRSTFIRSHASFRLISGCYHSVLLFIWKSKTKFCQIFSGKD